MEVLPSVGQWPATRVVARLPGSLPMGGVVHDTPIHSFVEPAPALAFAKPGLQGGEGVAAMAGGAAMVSGAGAATAARAPTPVRHDIDLGGLLAFEIRNLLTPAEADALIAASEIFGYRDEAPGISTPPGMRMNKSVHWLADDETMAAIHDRMAHLLPPVVDGRRRLPLLSARINMYRYDDGDVFNRHTDGDWPGYSLDEDRQAMVEWGAGRSALTMLLYLNGPSEGVQGGHTRLYRRDGRHVDVVPDKGSALFFRHGFGLDSVVHVGAQVSGPVPKYVARINVMYEDAQVPGLRRVVQAD